MINRFARRPLATLTLALLLGGTAAAPAAEPAPPETDAALRQKAVEVDRLKQELERAQTELQRLRQDNERLRQEKAAAPAMSPAAPSLPAAPSRPLTEVPPLSPETVLSATDLALYYRTDGAAADGRFRSREFRVTGQIVGFEAKLLRRVYEVVLGVPGSTAAGGQVVCRFAYREGQTAVYPAQKGQVLVASSPTRQESILQRVGQTVTIRGRGAGMTDGDVLLTGCEWVRTSAVPTP